MTLSQALRTVVLEKYARFDGRARRAEYWYFVLAAALLGIGAGFVDGIVGTRTGFGLGLVSTILSVAFLLPNLSVGARRLHDTDRLGWWLLIAAVPVVGAIVLIVFLAQDGTPGENRYGRSVALTPVG